MASINWGKMESSDWKANTVCQPAAIGLRGRKGNNRYATDGGTNVLQKNEIKAQQPTWSAKSM